MIGIENGRKDEEVTVILMEIWNKCWAVRRGPDVRSALSTQAHTTAVPEDTFYFIFSMHVEFSQLRNYFQCPVLLKCTFPWYLRLTLHICAVINWSENYCQSYRFVWCAHSVSPALFQKYLHVEYIVLIRANMSCV